MQSKFHAVAIVPRRGTACLAVTLIENVRYLSNEAPMLPLPTCDHPGECRCTYQHYADRRQEPRRDIDAGIAGRPYYDTERRLRPGRRATDQAKVARRR